MSLAVPYKNNAERGEIESFVDFAAKHIGEEETRTLEQQFNEGFLSKDYMTLNLHSYLSPKDGKKIE